jgi:hypothetical protein
MWIFNFDLDIWIKELGLSGRLVRKRDDTYMLHKPDQDQ